MKNIKFNLLGLLVLFATASTFIACNSDESIQNEELQKTLLTPELYSDFMLSDGKTNTDKENSKVGIGVTIKIGRKSRDCRSIGLCKIDKVTITIKSANADDELVVIPETIDEKKYIFLKLDVALDSDVYDTNLYIDEDIIDSENNISAVKAIYVLDETIGEFGGYKIPVNY